MTVFGPHYPAKLQPVINHAERLAALLHEHEIRNPPSDDAARAWLTGRAEEVEMVVGFIVADWREGQSSEGGTLIALSAYLREVHERAEEELPLGPVPACCVGDVAVTAPMTPCDPSPATVRVATPTRVSADTLFDPASVLEDSDRKPER